MLGIVKPARAAAQSPWQLDATEFTPFRDSAPWWRIWEGDGLAGKGVQRITLRRSEATVHLLGT